MLFTDSAVTLPATANIAAMTESHNHTASRAGHIQATSHVGALICLDLSTRSRRHAALAPQRRSASAFTAGSMTLRIATIPGESNDQYRRNFLRAWPSVPTARVSVRKIDSALATASARNVQMIF